MEIYVIRAAFICTSVKHDRMCMCVGTGPCTCHRISGVSCVSDVIGDVAGHGPDEAALGVALRIAWRTLTFAGLRGADRMRQLERIVRAERAGKGIFATVLSASELRARGAPTQQVD